MVKKSESYRKSKSGAKGVKDVLRTAEGVAVTPVKYSPGDAKVGDVSGFVRLTDKEEQFLEQYAECKADLKMIKAVTGLSAPQVARLVQKDVIKAEIEEIQMVWRLNRKMTAEHAAAKHIGLMQKLDKDYDTMDASNKTKMAQALVKASDTYLRAAGHFTHGGGEADTKVVINIDLGGDEKNEKKIKISGGEKE